MNGKEIVNEPSLSSSYGNAMKKASDETPKYL
jgi:hypothetical protein